MNKKTISLIAERELARLQRERVRADEPDPMILADTKITQWKMFNADETLEPLPPVAYKRKDIITIPGFPAEPRWVFVSYGNYIVTITASSPKLTSPHQSRINLHEFDRQTHLIGDPITGTWTQPFVFNNPTRALEQYMRILVEDLL